MEQTLKDLARLLLRSAQRAERVFDQAMNAQLLGDRNGLGDRERVGGDEDLPVRRDDSGLTASPAVYGHVSRNCPHACSVPLRLNRAIGRLCERGAEVSSSL